MPDQYIDVRLEVETARLMAERDPTAYLVETLRNKADETCREAGAHLRTDWTPEFLIQHAQHRITGTPVTLIASRWAVTAPRDLTHVPIGGGMSELTRTA